MNNSSSLYSLFSPRSTRDDNSSHDGNNSSRQSSFNNGALSASVDYNDNNTDIGRLSRHNYGARGLNGLLSKKNSNTSSIMSPGGGGGGGISRQNSGVSSIVAGNQNSGASSISPRVPGGGAVVSRQNSGASRTTGFRQSSLRQSEALYALTEEEEVDMPGVKVRSGPVTFEE